MKKNWILNNIGVKILSFLIALVSWIYINGQLSSQSSYTQISKRLPIKVDIIGTPLSGYIVDSSRIRTDPETSLIVGSKFLLDNVKFIQTEPIDVSGKNKTFTTQAYLRSIIDGTGVADGQIEATIPIAKVK